MVTVVRDLFNGTAGTTLPSRTPDVGGAWVTASGFGWPLELNGSGGVKTKNFVANAPDSESGILNGAKITQADCWAEVTFTVNGDLGSYIAIYLKSQYDPVANSPWGINGNNYIYGRLDVTAKTLTIGQEGAGSPYVTAASPTVTSNVEHTVRLEVIGTTITIYYDGISYTTTTANGVVAAAGWSGFLLRPYAASISVLEFRSGDFTADTGVAPVWTKTALSNGNSGLNRDIVNYHPGTNSFYAGTQLTANRLQVSSDGGLTWSASTSLSNVYDSALSTNGDLLFSYFSGNIRRIDSAGNHTTASSLAGSQPKLCWTGSTFVAINANTTYSTSVTGGTSTWSASTLGTSVLTSYDIAYGNNTLISLYSFDNRVFRNSSNVWTSAWSVMTVPLPATHRWYKVAFGAGKFVMVSGAETTSNKFHIAYSDDAIHWDVKEFTSVGNSGFGTVIFYNGMFVATNGQLTNGLLCLSVDGVAWDVTTSNVGVPALSNSGRLVMVNGSSTTVYRYDISYAFSSSDPTALIYDEFGGVAGTNLAQRAPDLGAWAAGYVWGNNLSKYSVDGSGALYANTTSPSIVASDIKFSTLGGRINFEGVIPSNPNYNATYGWNMYVYFLTTDFDSANIVAGYVFYTPADGWNIRISANVGATQYNPANVSINSITKDVNHAFALELSEGFIKFYVDGNVVTTQDLSEWGASSFVATNRRAALGLAYNTTCKCTYYRAEAVTPIPYFWTDVRGTREIK